MTNDFVNCLWYDPYSHECGDCSNCNAYNQNIEDEEELKMYNDCYATCGVGARNCKNKYCSANPHYVTPKPRVKPKQGPGKPCHTTRAGIRKDDGRGYAFNFKED